MKKANSANEYFKSSVKKYKRVVQRDSNLVTVSAEKIEGISYAFYLYVDGRVVEKTPYRLIPTCYFKGVFNSSEVFVKFFYRNNQGHKASINEFPQEEIASIKSNEKKHKNEIENNFFKEALKLLKENKINRVIIEFEKEFTDLSDKEKSHKYVDLINLAKLENFQESNLQVLSKIAVSLHQDRYTLMAHAGNSAKFGSIVEASIAFVKLKHDYGVENEKIFNLQKNLKVVLTKYSEEFEVFDTSVNASFNDLSFIAKNIPQSSIFEDDSLFNIYKEYGIHRCLENYFLVNFNESAKEKVDLLNKLSRDIKHINIDDAIYLCNISLSLLPNLTTYKIITELYFNNNQFYKSAYYLGFLDYYYSNHKHKLMGDIFLENKVKDFQNINKENLIIRHKKNFSGEYIELERIVDENEAVKNINSKINSFSLNSLDEKKEFIEKLYSSSGIEGIKDFFYEKSKIFSDFNLSGFLVLSASVILKSSYGDSVLLVEESFSNADSSQHYIDIIEFCNESQMFDLACKFIRILKKDINLDDPKYKSLQKLIETSPLNAALIQDLLPNNNGYYEEFEPVNGRICYILHNSLPYASGGYATRAHGVANGLAELGYEMYGINRPGYPFDVNKNYKLDGVDLKVKVDDVFYFHTAEPRRKSLYRYDYMEESIQIYQNYFLELKPQLVLAASAYISAFPALIAAKRLGIPFIYEVRGFWEVTLMSRDLKYKDTDKFFMMKSLEKIISNTADQVFTLTGAMKQELVEREVDYNKISVIPNSCFPEKFEPSNKNTLLAKEFNLPLNIPVIGYIGTFVDYEGLENLTEACGMLKARGIEFRLLLVGSENTSTKDKGPITRMIEQYAHKYDIEDWLVLPGRVPHEQVEGLYSLIDIAPFPRKPWPVCEMVSPMKPLEALAMKKAVIVSSVEALQEMVIDGQTGLVFDKNSIVDLADKLQVLILDEALRFRLGNNGREWVEKERSWEVTMSKAKVVIENYFLT